MSYTNKSKIVIVKNPSDLPGELIESLAIMSLDGEVMLIGSRKIYNKNDIKILSRGIPTKFLWFVLNLMRYK